MELGGQNQRIRWRSKPALIKEVPNQGTESNDIISTKTVQWNFGFGFEGVMSKLKSDTSLWFAIPTRW